MNLLAIRDKCISGQRVVVFPTCQLADPPDGAVDGDQAPPVALPPEDAFVIGRRGLSPALDERAVGVEQQLGVEQAATVSFVDADGDHDARLPSRLTECVGCRRGDGDRLVHQPEMFSGELERWLEESEVRVVRDNGFRECRELHLTTAQFGDLSDDLLNGLLAAVQHWAQLNRGGPNHGHGKSLRRCVYSM